jgi:hypothetical protein
VQWLLAAARDAAVVARYRTHMVAGADDECWVWTGAISGRGHGRFWVGDGHVTIAHRFGFAVAHHPQVMPGVISHLCDEPLCQNPAHLRPSTATQNRAEWAARRDRPGGPLRDLRGALGRARAIRDAARSGASVQDAADRGTRPVDRYDERLF